MTAWRQWILLFCGVLLGTVAAQAMEAVPLAEDPVVEQRLLVISEELRCLVCQNESLAGSRADLALDLRREIRTLIRAGKSDADIMTFMVDRYGDFVRYRPPFTPVTWLLWVGPFLLLLCGATVLMYLIRGRQQAVATPVLDEAQRAKAQALLQDLEPRP